MIKTRWNITEWSIVLMILLFNLITKWLFIDYPPVGGDEPFTLYYSQVNWDQLYQMIQNENNPPLFTLLMKGWTAIVGLEPSSFRVLPLLFASIAPLYIYKTGKLIQNRTTGLIAAGLFSFSTFHIYYAHEARPYALFTLLTTGAIYYFLKYVQKNERKTLILLTLFNILLIYNHYFGFLVLFTQFLGLFVLKAQREEIKGIVISWLISFTLYIPYLPIMYNRFVVSNTGGTWLSTPPATELYNLFVKFTNAPVIIASLILILAISISYYYIKTKTSKQFLTFLLIWTFIPLLVVFLISQKTPMFLDRYFVFVSIGFYLLSAFALANFPGKYIGKILTLIICSMMIFTINLKAGNKEPDDIIVETFKKNRLENEPAIIAPVYYKYNFAFHYSPSSFLEPKTTFTALNSDNIRIIENANQLKLSDYKNSDTLFYIGKGIDHAGLNTPIRKKLSSHFSSSDILLDDGKNVVIRYRN